MEQGLTNENKRALAVKQISQSALMLAITGNNFKEASRLMPSKIEKVFDQPKVFEAVLAIGEVAVLNQIEYELELLADLMSVGGNLNSAQITFIAKNLVELYPSESIADFKICFNRGAIGTYGDIQRMDGITLRQWMEKYLEEKYTVMENILMREKENIYAPIKLTEQEKKHMIDVDAMLNEYKATLKRFEPKAIRPMSEEEIKAEGQDDPDAAYRAYRENYFKNRKQ